MLSHSFHLFAPSFKNNHRPKILHNNSLLVLLGLLLMVQSVVGAYTNLNPDILGYASVIDPEKVISLTNNQRLQAGLEPLHINDKLNQAALAKASDMFEQNYWAHVSPAGTSPWAFINQTGYQYLHAGENLAKDFSSSDTIVKAWMNSPTHKRNILDPRFKDIGIAVVDGYINNRETTLIVQLFASSQDATSQPLISSSRLISQVYANSTTSSEIYASPISPLTISKVISLSFIILLIITLSLDWLFVWKKRLVRLSGKNWAHLTFFIAITIITLIIKQGIVL